MSKGLSVRRGTSRTDGDGWQTAGVFVPRRLDKFLRDATPLSVVGAREALAAGRVTIADVACTLDARLVFQDDAVRLDGALVTPRRAHFHAMLHKPRSVTSSARDPEGKADLSRFLEQMPPGAFPIGRLDRDTTGLLLFTDDGDFANAVLHPDHHTDKVYWLWLDEPVADDDPRLVALTEGVPVLGQTARAKSVVVQHRTEQLTELLVTLCEGKNRQIRRMCRALDFRLVALHRRSVGPLQLGTLPAGQWRPLAQDEVRAAWQATGGPERVMARKIAALRRMAAAARQGGAPELRLEAWLASVN